MTITDLSPFRLDLARAMGLRTERSDAPGEDDFDVLLECSGAPGVLGRPCAGCGPPAGPR